MKGALFFFTCIPPTSSITQKEEKCHTYSAWGMKKVSGSRGPKDAIPNHTFWAYLVACLVVKFIVGGKRAYVLNE